MGFECPLLKAKLQKYVYNRIFGQTYGNREIMQLINPLTPNDLYRRSAVSPLKIKISSKNMREKATNTPIIHSVY
jgi:hypothetical protein